MSSPASTRPELDATVELAAGTYRLGEPGEERDVALAGVRIGRWPVVNARSRASCEATGRDVSPGAGAQARRPAARRPPRDRRDLRRRGGVLRVGRRRAAAADRRRVGGRRARRRRRARGRGATSSTPRALRLRRVGLGLDGAGRRAPGRRRPVRRRAARRQRVGVGGRPHRGRLARGARRLLPRPRAGACAPRASLPADPARATPTTGFRLVDRPEGGARDARTDREHDRRAARGLRPLLRGPRHQHRRHGRRRGRPRRRRRTSTSTSCSRPAGARSWPRCPTPSPTACARSTASRPSTSRSCGTPSGRRTGCRESARDELAHAPRGARALPRAAASPREEPDMATTETAPPSGRARAQGRRVRLRLRLPHLQLRPGQRARAARADVRRAPLRLPPAAHQGGRARSSPARSS